MGLSSNPDHPRIRRSVGIPTEGRQRRGVIFFANLLSLFFGNRGGASLLADEIQWVDSYGGRLLPALGLIFGSGNHVLVLEREPDRALSDFFEVIGLELPKQQILTRAGFLELGQALEGGGQPDLPLLRRLRAEPAEVVDGFVTDPTIGRIAEALGKRTLSTPEGSHRGNNKLLLHRHLEATGLPVPPTLLAESPEDVARSIAELGRAGHRHAVIKAQIGASGIGLTKTPTDPGDLAVPPSFFHEGPCMVQAWLEPGVHGIESVLSPSVQLFVDEGTIYLYDLTEQILDAEHSIHQGNEAPPPYVLRRPGIADELFRQAGEAATWLHGQGYRGAASVDFLVACPAGRAPVVYVCEINARVTGATYPSVLARHFRPRGAWRMRNLELARPMDGARLLERLRRKGELFDPARPRGILPVNFNLDPEGRVRKGQFLAMAGDLLECRHLLDTARADLPVKWDYTHDR